MLEFVFAGSVTIGKTVFTKWSVLRHFPSGKIANAHITSASASSLRGKENIPECEVEDSTKVADALLDVLAKATGQSQATTRSLRKAASLPVTEEDISHNFSLYNGAVAAFVGENPTSKRLHFHPAVGTMCSSLDDKPTKALKDFQGNGQGPSIKDIMLMVAESPPFKLEWIDMAAELVEFTVQQGGFPHRIVETLFSSKESAENFGALRASYSLHCLSMMFGVESGGAFVKITPRGLSDFQQNFARSGESTDKLRFAFGRWDMAMKPKSAEEWANAWSDKLNALIQGKDLSYNAVYSSIMSVIFKGKLVENDGAIGEKGDGHPSAAAGLSGYLLAASFSSQDPRLKTSVCQTSDHGPLDQSSGIALLPGASPGNVLSQTHVPNTQTLLFSIPGVRS